MKVFRTLLVGCGCLWCVVSPAQQVQQVKIGPALAELQNMQRASQTLNYEMAYISVSRQGIESLRYRHAVAARQQLAQLLKLDGSLVEITQRDKDISYFDVGLEPFTIKGDHIVDGLPAVVYAHLPPLTRYYDFIVAGRTRIANRWCQVIRVVSRDRSRYSYAIWVDMQQHLPLRADLLDDDGETLEQFRVIAFEVGPTVVARLKPLTARSLPPLLNATAQKNLVFSWQPSWLPDGVQEVSRSRKTLAGVRIPLESRFYSDGLFSFTVTVSARDEAAGVAEQLLRSGRRTLYSEIKNDRILTLVGEIPPDTAKRIVQSITDKTL